MSVQCVYQSFVANLEQKEGHNPTGQHFTTWLGAFKESVAV